MIAIKRIFLILFIVLLLVLFLNMSQEDLDPEIARYEVQREKILKSKNHKVYEFAINEIDPIKLDFKDYKCMNESYCNKEKLKESLPYLKSIQKQYSQELKTYERLLSFEGLSENTTRLDKGLPVTVLFKLQRLKLQLLSIDLFNKKYEYVHQELKRSFQFYVNSIKNESTLVENMIYLVNLDDIKKFYKRGIQEDKGFSRYLTRFDLSDLKLDLDFQYKMKQTLLLECLLMKKYFTKAPLTELLSINVESSSMQDRAIHFVLSKFFDKNQMINHYYKYVMNELKQTCIYTPEKCKTSQLEYHMFDYLKNPVGKYVVKTIVFSFASSLKKASARVNKLKNSDDIIQLLNVVRRGQ